MDKDHVDEATDNEEEGPNESSKFNSILEEATDNEEEGPNESSKFNSILDDDKAFKTNLREVVELTFNSDALISALSCKLKKAGINMDNIPFNFFCKRCITLLSEHFSATQRPFLAALITDIFCRVEVGENRNVYGELSENQIQDLIVAANVNLQTEEQALLSSTVNEALLSRQQYLKLQHSGGLGDDRYLIAIIYGWYSDGPNAGKFSEEVMKSLIRSLFKKYFNVLR
jgi:hypothetical protein